MSKVLGQLMTLMPTTIASNLTMRMVCKPRAARLRPAEIAAIATSKTHKWGEKLDKAAYQWPADKSGTVGKILMFHGWGGSAAQMAPLAEALVRHGHTVIAVDFTAHGGSPGHTVSFEQMIRDVTDAYNAFGNDYQAVVGHSAGGLSMMAARLISGLDFKKMVCINVPISPYPPIRALKRVLNPPRRIVDACNQRVLSQFQAVLTHQGDSACYQPQPGEQLLIITDTDDAIADSQDSAKILSRWPGAERMITRKLGHLGTLQDAAVAERVNRFCS